MNIIRNKKSENDTTIQGNIDKVFENDSLVSLNRIYENKKDTLPVGVADVD